MAINQTNALLFVSVLQQRKIKKSAERSAALQKEAAQATAQHQRQIQSIERAKQQSADRVADATVRAENEKAEALRRFEVEMKNQEVLEERIFQMDDRISNIDVGGDSAAVFLELKEITEESEYLSQFIVKNLEYKKLSAKAKKLIDVAVVQNKESLGSEVEEILTTVIETRKTLQTLIELHHNREIRPGEEKDYNDTIENIRVCVEVLRRYFSEKKDLMNSHFPDILGIIQSAVEEILIPRSVDMFLIDSLILIIKADGVLDDSEKIFFTKLVESIHVPADEALERLERVTTISPKSFLGDEEDAVRIVTVLAACAGSDGTVDPREATLISKIGKAIGVTNDKICELLKNPTQGFQVGEVYYDSAALVPVFTKLWKIQQKIQKQKNREIQGTKSRIFKAVKSTLNVDTINNIEFSKKIPSILRPLIESFLSEEIPSGITLFAGVKKAEGALASTSRFFRKKTIGGPDQIDLGQWEWCFILTEESLFVFDSITPASQKIEIKEFSGWFEGDTKDGSSIAGIQISDSEVLAFNSRTQAVFTVLYQAIEECKRSI